jgi:hypothetical protein
MLSNLSLENKHSIAEAEEAVLVLEGMAVAAEGEVGAGEGSDEKE